MSKLHYLFLFLLLFFNFTFYGQKKMLEAKSIAENITIDGKTNEQVWESASIATDFIMFEPDNGKPINLNSINNLG